MNTRMEQSSLLPLLLTTPFWCKLYHISTQLTSLSVLPHRPAPDDLEEWYAYWEAQGQSWRTEPEINEQRKQELARRRAIVPDIGQSIYPFKGVQLSRADVEWLLATHDSGRGPVDWSDGSQRRRKGLDLRGADLHHVDLSRLPLARLQGGLRPFSQGGLLPLPTNEQYSEAAVHLEDANLQQVHLEGSLLNSAHLEHASLNEAHLEGAFLEDARLEGARLNRVHLERASLAVAHLDHAYLEAAHLEFADLGSAHLKGAYVCSAHLEGANLYCASLKRARFDDAHLENADLTSAHLEGAFLIKTHMEGAILHHAFLDEATQFDAIYLENKKFGAVSLADVRWGGTNVTAVDWSSMAMLEDERTARQRTMSRNELRRKGLEQMNLVRRGEDLYLIPVLEDTKRTRQQKISNEEQKSRKTRLNEHQLAVRANRQLGIVLQTQGLNESAVRFAYRAQVLQRRTVWFQMLQPRVKFRRRIQILPSWLFSWFLFLLAGYGYRPSRSFLAYLLVISGFATAYYLLGHTVGPTLSPLGAFVFSMTSFHGRGFFPGNNISLDAPLTVLAALEALVGLIIEVTFIATLTQRFFNR